MLSQMGTMDGGDVIFGENQQFIWLLLGDTLKFLGFGQTNWFDGEQFWPILSIIKCFPMNFHHLGPLFSFVHVTTY